MHSEGEDHGEDGSGDRPGDRSDEQRDRWITRREGPNGKLIVAAVALGLLLLFVLQNTEEIRIVFMFWDGFWPAWIVILLVALLGLGVGWLAATMRGRRIRRRERDGD